MKKFMKYFIFSILTIEIFNVFSLYQVKADNQLNDEYIYKNGDLRCPPNASGSTCELRNNGEEVVVTHTEQDIVIKKHVKKTETIGRYKVWFELENKDKATTQIVSSNTYVYFVVDASATNEKNLGNISQALKSFYSILENKNIYFSGGSFAKDAVKFNSNFKTSANDLKINLKPDGSTSHIYKSLNDAVSMFNNSNIKPEDKKIVVILGDGKYYRCTDFKASKSCHDNDKAKVQVSMLNNINNSLKKLRNQGVELYFIKYGTGGSNGYTYYQNLYDLPDEYFDKEQFKCQKGKKCHAYYNKDDIKYNLLKYASSDNAVTKEVVKYIIRAGNNIKVGNDISNYYIENSGSFQTTLDNLANKITNNVKNVNISYDYELIDNIYDAFINVSTGFQGGTHEYRISGDGKITTDAFYIKISDDLKYIANEDDWYNTNNDFSLKFKKDEKDINILCDVNPQVYWPFEKLNVDSCLGTAQYNEEYDLSSKYYTIKCEEGYDNNSGFVANFNVGGLTTKTNKFSTGGFGFPVSVDLSTNIKCTYKFDTNTFKVDYNNLNSCLSANKEDTPEYASCYKEKNDMDKIVNNYVDIVGSSNNKGKNLEKYILDFENINGKLVFNYNDNTSDNLDFINSNFTKNIQCTNGVSSTLVNNKVVYTDFSCNLSLAKKLQLDNTCIDMQTANKTNCSSSTINGGNLYYMDLDKEKASVIINIQSTGYMGNVGIGLQNCSASQAVDFDVVFRQIDLNDPFLENYDNNREVGSNYLNTEYNFKNIINDVKRTDGKTWENLFDYRYQLSKQNVYNIRKDTAEEGINSYLGRNCYISNYKYVCDFTRNNISSDGVNIQVDWFTKVEINR